MKKLKILFLTLSLLTIAGCKTTKQENKIELPPRPQRELIELPATLTIKDCAELINYYEHLVQEWEAWADTVEKIAG